MAPGEEVKSSGPKKKPKTNFDKSSSITTCAATGQKMVCGLDTYHSTSSHESNCFFFLPISYRPTILWANEFLAGLNHHLVG
jgi:hypothetical protein